MKRIEEEQSEPQPIHLLPQIHRSDLSKISDIKTADEVCQNGLIDVFINPTNGVIYGSVVVSVEKVDLPNIFLLSFVRIANTLIGAGPFEEFEMTNYVQRWVSSLYFDASVSDTIRGTKQISLTISSSCLNEDVQKLSEIMKFVATEAHWNNTKKLEILVNQSKLILSKMKLQSFELFNEIRAESILIKEGAIDEAVGGLIGLNKFEDFLKNKSIPEISEACETLYKQILTNGRIHGYVSCSGEMKEKAFLRFMTLFRKFRTFRKLSTNRLTILLKFLPPSKARKLFSIYPLQLEQLLSKSSA